MGSEGDVSGGRWRRLGPDAGERRRRGRANEPYPTEFGIAHRELSRATSAGLKARHEAARVNRQSSPSSSPGDDCCAALACLLPRAKPIATPIAMPGPIPIARLPKATPDPKSTRLNYSHSYATRM